MIQLFNIILMLLGFLMLLIPFLDKVVLKQAHKRKLQSQFELWWRTVEHYDKLRLSLLCAKWANDTFDELFGKHLISKKVIVKCAIAANSMLFITLAWLGFADGEPFGVTPWKNYTLSVKVVEVAMDSILADYDITVYGVFSITNAPVSFNEITNAMLLNKVQTSTPIHLITNQFALNIGTNAFVMTISKNGVARIDQVEPLGNGNLNVFYQRRFNLDEPNISTNFVGVVHASNNPFKALQEDAMTFRTYVEAHDKATYIVSYSVAYFVLTMFINTFLFIGSLCFCRVMLREIVSAGRLVSTLALVFSNVTVLFCFASSLLLIFTFLSIPLLWLCFPVIFRIGNESIYTLSVFVAGASVALFLMSGISAKLVAFIAFLPNVFAGIIGFFSVLAMKWKNAFHFILSEILIRCVESSPITVILATIIFITALIAFVAKWLHLTAFL